MKHPNSEMKERAQRMKENGQMKAIEGLMEIMNKKSS